MNKQDDHERQCREYEKEILELQSENDSLRERIRDLEEKDKLSGDWGDEG